MQSSKFSVWRGLPRQRVANAAAGMGQLQPHMPRVVNSMRQLHALFSPSSSQVQRRRSLLRGSIIQAVASAETASAAYGFVGDVSKATTYEIKMACPICQTTEFVINSTDPYQPRTCGRCKRTFTSKSQYLDLTLTSGVQQQVYSQKQWQGTELFRQPLVSFVYERGWRQNFAGAGFPGPEKEFDMAMKYLEPVQGGVLVDASCGTGLFTRLFARSNKFKSVVALDYSESMLQQAQRFFREDPALSASTPIVAVRADIGRLPFATGSVDAIHAGAAIHCWPNPQAAMAEISRVLKPGGVFVASTFLTVFAPLGELIGDQTVRPLSQGGGGGDSRYKLWEEQELADLCSTVGLVGYTRHRLFRFIMFSTCKPAQ